MKPLILVVEDEPPLQKLLAYNLEAAGFAVAQAYDGEEAQVLIEERIPDLLLLDWMLPHLSGLELCRRLRRRAETAHLPIIMLTARGEEPDRLRGLDTGADDFIAKPFSPAELIARIRAVLRRISPSVADAAVFVTTEQVTTDKGRSGARIVLARAFVVGSICLWVAYFMGLVIFYALINWMPILFKDAGLDPSTAALISALFPLGGVGAILSGWLMDRFNANLIIGCCFAATAVAIYAIGQTAGSLGLLMLVVLVAGTLMNTAQSSLPALAAAFYPTAGRATGVAWMLGLGRFGGIAGSFLVAELARRQLTFPQIFTTVAIPGLIAMAALLLKQLVHPEQRSAGPAVRKTVPGH